MARPVGRRVVIGRAGDRMTVGGVYPCGLRLCPYCGPRREAVHREDLARMVSRWREKGGQVLFLTLTIRHSWLNELGDLLGSLQAMYDALLVSSGTARRDRARFGIVGTCRATEINVSDAHGWHPHHHVLLFVQPRAAGEEEERRRMLFSRLVERWGHLAQAQGLTASTLGQDLRDVTQRDIDTMAAYLTKQGSDPWTIADEMTRQSAKHAHPGRRSAAELLADALDGDEGARVLVRELESGMKGRRLWGTTPKLRDQIGAGPAPDVDALIREPEPDRVPLAWLDAEEWSVFFRLPGALGLLSYVVASGASADEVVAFFAERSITALPHLPRTTGPPGGAVSAPHPSDWQDPTDDLPF